MNRKVYTARELMTMDRNNFELFHICLAARAYRLLGMNWKRWIRVSHNHADSIVFEWE